MGQGANLPQIVVEPPGPRSRALAQELRRYESPNVTFVSDDFPIFWEHASGSNVIDVDGNRYIDLSAAFGVASVGHSNPRMVEAIRQQAERLIHGMGDVHPAAPKVELARKLAQITPGALQQTILSSSGSEAVESALKTARMHTQKPGVLAFEGAYHGLTYGALAATSRQHFRGPFRDQLGIPVTRVPYPYCYRCPWGLRYPDCGVACLEETRKALDRAEGEIGTAIIEPILGRGGVVVPPPEFLPGLRRLTRERDILLIADEVFTGFGRSGRWFAVDHGQVAPDLMCLGKSMAGGMPISACIGTPEVMASWGPSTGEAIHTSTFLGHPLGCAAALASIREIEKRNLVERSAELGGYFKARLLELQARHPQIGDVRGEGLMLGIELIHPDIGKEGKEPNAELAKSILVRGLKKGLILLTAGDYGNVLSFTPPLVIEREQIDYTIEVLDRLLSESR